MGPTVSEFGLTWDAKILGRVLESWQTFGLTRNMAMIDPVVVAEAVIHSIKAPMGAVYASIELQPTAALDEGSPAPRYAR